MKRVVIVGAGAAGILAAIKAAENGARVLLLEKMAMPGRKLMITGKGRCNITNACDMRDMIPMLPGNGKFLFGAFHTFTNRDIMELLEENGLPVKVERGGRVFPQSDRALDVVETLEKILRKKKVELRTNTRVRELVLEQGRVTGVGLRGRQDDPCGCGGPDHRRGFLSPDRFHRGRVCPGPGSRAHHCASPAAWCPWKATTRRSGPSRA